MTKNELIQLAKRAVDKRWDYEQLKYGDDLYGKESLVDDVWEYVEEHDKIGRVAFDAKYAEIQS